MKYENYKINKKLKLQDDVEKAKEFLTQQKKSFFFQKWKVFCHNAKIYRNQIENANQYRLDRIKFNYFARWRVFARNKIQNKFNLLKAINFDENLLKTRYFKMFVKFAKTEGQFKLLMSEAKQLYQNHLLEDGIKQILEIGTYYQKQRFNYSVKKSVYLQDLAIKYFRKWKFKTWNSTKIFEPKLIKKKVKIIEPAVITFSNFSDLRPRVPEFLKSQYCE